VLQPDASDGGNLGGSGTAVAVASGSLLSRLKFTSRSLFYPRTATTALDVNK